MAFGRKWVLGMVLSLRSRATQISWLLETVSLDATVMEVSLQRLLGFVSLILVAVPLSQVEV
jgi:hypothetical protein